MAKIEGEKRASLSEVVKGTAATELKFRMSFGGEDMHYPGEMISGCKLMEKCIDCVTELSNLRDNGDGGYFVHTLLSLEGTAITNSYSVRLHKSYRCS